MFDARSTHAGVALLVVFGLGLKRSDGRLLALSAPAVLMLAAYTAISQNLPRFFAPTHPLMVLCLMLLLFSSPAEPKRLPPDHLVLLSNLAYETSPAHPWLRCKSSR
ncbi:MAG: hypothetical protein R3E56_17085 [Burkholderiaceae bacterium]